MIKSLQGFINELKIFVVCESEFMDVYDIVQQMLENGMFELPGYSLDDMDYNAIFKNFQACLLSGSYTEEEVMGYLLKYLFGFKNKNIYGTKLYVEDEDHFIDCSKLNIRRVERIYMNLRRRQFIQPCYTKPTFKKIGEIVAKPRIKDKISLFKLNDMDVKDFPAYYFKQSLNNNISKEFQEFKELLCSISNIECIDVNEYPWNVLAELNRMSGDSSYDYLQKYLRDNKLTMDDIFQNIDLVRKVTSYNICAFISDNSRLHVVFEKFINHKMLSEINVKSNSSFGHSRDFVSLTRVQQLYDSALRAILIQIREGTFLFDGFELFMNNQTAKLPNVLLNTELPDAVKDTMLMIVANAANMSLRQLTNIIYENPLMHNIMMYGYTKGLIVSNQELRVSKDIDKTPILPEYTRDLKMSVRATGALIRNGYQRTSDLILLSYSQLHNLKNIGKKSADEIIDTLRTYGVYITNKEENTI